MATTLARVAPAVFLACLTLSLSPGAEPPTQNWTHFVRIGAYGLAPGKAEAIVRDATKGHVFGIEVDNDIP